MAFFTYHMIGEHPVMKEVPANQSPALAAGTIERLIGIVVCAVRAVLGRAVFYVRTSIRPCGGLRSNEAPNQCASSQATNDGPRVTVSAISIVAIPIVAAIVPIPVMATSFPAIATTVVVAVTPARIDLRAVGSIVASDLYDAFRVLRLHRR